MSDIAKKIASACSPADATAEEKQPEPIILALPSAHQVKPLTMGKMMSQFDKSFAAWDKNKDGKISLKELQEALEWLKIEVSEDDLKKIDNDHDGDLNLVEFRHAFYMTALKHADMDHNQLVIKTFETLKGKKDEDAIKMRQESSEERSDRYQKAAKLKAELRDMYKAIDPDDEDVDIKDLKLVLKKLNMQWENEDVTKLLDGLKAEYGECDYDDFEATVYTAAMKSPDAKLSDLVSFALNHIFNVAEESK